MKEKFLEFQRLIEKSEKILTICHKRPDGDTLGSGCAFYVAMKQMGKNIDIACIDEASERFNFLPEINRIIHEFDFREYDLIVVMDAGASYMTNYHTIYPDIFKGDVPVVNIDHHASNDNFGNCNIVDENAASATMILYNFFEYIGIRITPAMATCLLTGIYNDTGSLMHQNTSLDVFEIAGKLVGFGAKVNVISRNLFRKTPVSTLKLWGRALENVRVNSDGVTVSVLTWRDFEECGAAEDASSGVVDLLNSVPGSKYTCLLNEDRNGNVKGSFRTQEDDVDLEELAARFGGGGHKKAAGFTMPGRIHQEIQWKIVPSQELPAGTSLPKTV